MLDGCAVGNVLASPSAQKMSDLIKACDYGSGVVCLYRNYGGDNMSFDMACEMVSFDDIKTKTVRVNDDVASSPKETADEIAETLLENILPVQSGEVSVIVNGMGATPL